MLGKSTTTTEFFVKHWLAGERIEELVRDKQLNFGQVGFLYLLTRQINPRSGLISTTMKAMAEATDYDYAAVRRWMAKLLSLRLVVRWRDPKQGTTHLVVHPYIASVGSAGIQGLTWRRYCEGLEGREPPIPVPDNITTTT